MVYNSIYKGTLYNCLTYQLVLKQHNAFIFYFYKLFGLHNINKRKRTEHIL